MRNEKMANTLSQAIKKMTFRERKNGLLEGRASYQGEQKSVYGHSKAECQNKARQYFENKDKVVEIPAEDITLGDYMEKWLVTYHKAKVDEPSYIRSQSIYKCQIKDSNLAKMPITKITTSDIQAFINDYAYGETHETPDKEKNGCRFGKRNR